MTMAIRVRLVYADGDVAATLLQHMRWSYAFVALLHPSYIKSEIQLIYVQLNVAMLQLAIMNHILIMLDNRRSRQDRVGGPKGPGLVHDYRQTDGYNVGTMTN